MGAAARVWLGLGFSLISALVVSWAYAREHAAAVTLPAVSIRHPSRSVATLLADRRWLAGFAAEGGGWVVYLVALGLAPLALVQAVNASGVGILALLATGGRLGRLSARARLAVGAAVGGLVLLGLSLVGTTPSEQAPRPVLTTVWLAACLVGAAVFAARWTRVVHAATLGTAAGFLFAGGDTSAKLMVQGGGWMLAGIPLLIFYGLGSIQLQSAFQHGNVLVAAGTANLATNAIPIVTGIVLFHEVLPQGWQLVAQVGAFAAIVSSGVLLADRSRGAPAVSGSAPPNVVERCS